MMSAKVVSKPNGAPRPFRHGVGNTFKGKSTEISNPNGIPRPFPHRHWNGYDYGTINVSNPNGLPRPFRQEVLNDKTTNQVMFQTRTGFPGHSDEKCGLPCNYVEGCVSNPNGLPRPFRRCGG